MDICEGKTGGTGERNAANRGHSLRKNDHEL